MRDRRGAFSWRCGACGTGGAPAASGAKARVQEKSCKKERPEMKRQLKVKQRSEMALAERGAEEGAIAGGPAAAEGTIGATAGQEEIVLLGQPPLCDYLDFIREMGVGGEDADPRLLTDEWRLANDYYHDLEEREAGIADAVDIGPLDPALAPLAEEVMSDPRYRCTFDAVPGEFAMVELDRLVVYQTQVTRGFIEGLKRRLGPGPDPVRLFRFCMPLGQPEAPLRARRMGSRRFVFSSYSMDVRYHEPVLLRPDQIRDYHTFGAIGGVVGLVIGFSSNLLNVIRSDGRLLLHNGYHRACAMRALGITHAPAIVQTVTRRDELDVCGPKAVVENPAFYFRAARPPLLKDFFDPKIRKVLPVHKTLRVVEVNFEVREFEVPE